MHTRTALCTLQKCTNNGKAAAPAPAPAAAAAAAAVLPQPIARSFSISWRELDVRAMVLLSLLLQIALFVLGKRRKHTVSLINKMILWFAYQSKEWIILAALGKLPNSQVAIATLAKVCNLPDSQGGCQSCGQITPSSNPNFWSNLNFPPDLLTSLWAPLLILHLGDPDTITAYSFQDTQLWTRHLLTLVVQSFIAFCVIFWSLSSSWSLVFTISLYFVGISKYVERILCLKVTDSMKAKQIISFPKNPSHLSHPLSKNQESNTVLLGYALFSAMRLDVNDYLCHKEYPLSLKVRIRTYRKETNDEVIKFIGEKLPEKDEPKLLEKDELKMSNSHLTHFDIAVVELGFIFDVVYTKAAFIYTKKGCILRLTSFTLAIGILLYFLTLIMDSKEYKLSPIDVCITISLLVGVVALDICAVFSILCSDWAVILMHDNCLVRKILHCVLRCFPSFLSQQKRRSARMGQCDLLDYCWNSSKARSLQKHCSSDILENWHRFKYTRFVEVPDCLKSKEVYQSRLDSFFSGDPFFSDDSSFEATRGKKTLDELREEISYIYPGFEWSIKVDFDASIIAWHLATSICYHRDYDPKNAPDEAMKSSKYLSDYMMYLLVMQPAMLLPDNCRSFWLDRALDKLRDPLSKQSNKKAAFDLLLQNLPEFSSPQTAMDNLPEFAGHLSEKLNQTINKWELIKAMWIEMLLYAAHSCQHLTHVKQLGKYGREFLTIIWVMGGHRIIQEVIKEE